MKNASRKSKSSKIMKIVYEEGHSVHVPTREIENGEWIENPEKPERIESIKELLLRDFASNFVRAKQFSDTYLYMVHSEEYVSWLKEKCSNLPEGSEYIAEVFGHDRCFDTGTPILKKTYEAARLALDVTLTASEIVLFEESFAYALTRPPGHHATGELSGGYCYFNNVAVAASFFMKHGIDRVSILDIDFHHGNGTQEIFYSTKNVQYVSIHGDPRIYYPWISGRANEVGINDGKGFNINFPLEKASDWTEYKKALKTAVHEIENFSPRVLIVSLGFDTHRDDPVGDFTLEDRDYDEMGQIISKVAPRILFVQEGGYNPSANARAACHFFSFLL